VLANSLDSREEWASHNTTREGSMSWPCVSVERDVFLARFLDGLIECDTMLDAVAVKTADDILSGRSSACRPIHLERLAAVLNHYGQLAGSEMLLAEARRMRGGNIAAFEFVTARGFKSAADSR
jgi:hypothetical protein